MEPRITDIIRLTGSRRGVTGAIMVFHAALSTSEAPKTSGLNSDVGIPVISDIFWARRGGISRQE